MNLQDSFKEFCEKNKFEINIQQIKIINLLDKFLNYKETFLSSFFKKFKKKEQLCFYLHGKVGVGKTMLLNFVYDRLEIKKNRQHFNEFMINFHDFRHEKKDNNTLRTFVKKIKEKYDLIYLDEFQVTNIVDAMILGKLFEIIFEEKIKIIITTNTKLNDLYKDGLQREQFLPFIKIIENFSDAIGSEGMLAGQFLDLEAESPLFKLTLQKFKIIQQKKTSLLIAFSSLTGAMLGGASQKEQKILLEYGLIIGKIFQITDDILDVEGNEKVMGKKINKDKKLNKATLIRLKGITYAKKEVERLVSLAKNELKKIRKDTKILEEFTDFLSTRVQ